MSDSIKMINAALDEDGEEIILRGVIDPASMDRLLVDDYQREILPMARIKDLAEAIQKGGVPDLDLGMRGASYTEREGNFYLQNEVYIVDGLQRRTAAMELIRKGIMPHLGATVHFNTSYKWEKARFKALNVSRARLSSNVLMRNERDVNEGVDLLYKLCLDSSFVLKGRVSWDQRMKREHLVPASILIKATAMLHTRLGTGLAGDTGDRIGNLHKLTIKLGRGVVRENVKRFWELIQDCWGVREVVYSSSSPQLRSGFLRTLATVLANHKDFWADANLVVPADLRKKLATFPLTDPHVASLCGVGGAARGILYTLIVDHINSGKRTRRLTPFDNANSIEMEEEVVA